jgi:hypothetical protein
MLWMNRLQPPELADVIWGGVEGVCGPQSAPLFWQWWIFKTSHQSVFRAIHTLNSPKNYIRLLGGCCLSIHCAGAERKTSCGALGGTRGPFPPVVVMVGYGCVGRCWLLEANVRSIYCRNSKICLRKFFNSYVYPIHSWHPTRQLNKEDLNLCTLLFSWFLCPVFYGNLMLTSSFHSSTTSLWTIYTAPQWDGSKMATRQQQDG